MGPDRWSEHCPPIGDHHSGGSRAGPADPRAHLGNGPHRSLVAHHPTPKPASSLRSAPLLYLRYPLHLAGFTASRPPGLPAQQQGRCFTDQHLIPSLLYRKSWRRPPLPQDKVPTPRPPASVWVPLTLSCSSEHSAPPPARSLPEGREPSVSSEPGGAGGLEVYSNISLEPRRGTVSWSSKSYT